ncbi:MAG TPA: radical SAM protein [Methanosarcinaceae archaeon]|nr:radical SAM protein [Methanosarcinaceae archaeon]
MKPILVSGLARNMLYPISILWKNMRVSYLAISEKRCTVQISGCNFKCRGCFSNEKGECGMEITGSQLAKYIPADKEIMLAGGEPTLDRQEMLSTISELKNKPGKRKIIISTNGSRLDKDLLEELEGITVHIDLKAYGPELHRWYTGKDNKNVLSAIRLLYEQDFDFQVSTVFIPDIIETPEIGDIARFLSEIGDIRYKIMRYVPVGDFSRRPYVWEIEDAVNTAHKYLGNVTSSMENRSHPKNRKTIATF